MDDFEVECGDCENSFVIVTISDDQIHYCPFCSFPLNSGEDTDEDDDDEEEDGYEYSRLDF